MKEYIPGIISGLIFGAAAGIVAGFLLAPMPGKDIRDVFREKVEDVGDLVKETVGDRKKTYQKSWQEQRQHTVSKPYHRHI